MLKKHTHINNQKGNKERINCNVKLTFIAHMFHIKLCLCNEFDNENSLFLIKTTNRLIRF